MKWKSFLIGFIIGVVLTLAAVFAAGSRYKVAQSAGGLTVKLDKWSGKSWMARYFGEKEPWYWVEIKNQ